MMLGYLEQAEAESMKSLEHRERLGHKPSISHTHMFRAEFCIILDRVAEADAHLRASISIAEKYSLAGYLAADNITQGWARAAGPSDLTAATTLAYATLGLSWRCRPI